MTTNILDLRPNSGITDEELRASSVGVQDDYTDGEYLEDQVGANNVLTFTFSQEMALVWVKAFGPYEGAVRVVTGANTPTPTSGIHIDAGVNMPLPQPATVVRVYCPSGMTVNVYGQYR